MIKRPICIGAVLLMVVLWIGRWFGVPGEVPRPPEGEEESTRVLGRVCARERTAKGTRLYLNQFSYLSSSMTDIDRSKAVNQSISENFNTEDQAREKRITSGNRKRDQILVYLKGRPREMIAIGSWVIVEGRCSIPDTAGNPGQFDARNYYLPRKILFLMYEGELLRRDNGRSAGSDLLALCREKLCASYEQVMSETDSAVISAITMGDRTRLDQETRRMYQEGGIAHILAISSLHITLIGREIYRFLRRCRCSFMTAGIGSAMLLFGFCLMTGMSVSAVRACIMFCLWLGSQMAGRTNDSSTSAALAAVFVLLSSPEYLWDSGFLLSFGCILSLLCLSPLLTQLLPAPGRVGRALQTSAAVWLGTLPIGMYFFYQVTPYAILVNLAVLPCMALLMATGMLGGIVGMISVPAGILAAAPCHYLLRLFELLCRWERRLPGAVWITGRPVWWKIAVYYGILTTLCLAQWVQKKRTDLHIKKERGREDRRRRIVFLCKWIAVAAAIGILTFRVPPKLRITFLDVGQGDGILIESGGFACMIDGGSSTVENVWQYRIESTLKYYGISRLDAVFLTHGDLDHISGIQELLENYETNFWGGNTGSIALRRLLLPDTGYEDEKLSHLRMLAENCGISTGLVGMGDSLFTGKLKMDCLYPDPEYSIGDSNADSMVLRLEYGEFSALFTGDLEKTGEQRFLEQYLIKCAEKADSEKISVLKVGHHGSKNASSEKFLEVLQPDVAVISCGEKNPYGHPAEELLGRLEDVNTKIFRTDRDGAVIIRVKENTASGIFEVKHIKTGMEERG